MIGGMPTNAQTALTAAATVFSGARGYGTAENVIAVAGKLKAWLDQQDAAEPAQPDLREVQLDALVEHAGPQREPELHERGHHWPIGFGSNLLR